MTDLTEILMQLTNLIINERVKSYNEGVDAERDRCAAIAKELEEAIVMADNRLEAALISDDVCRACVEVARSYLSPVLPMEKGLLNPHEL